ncbi:MAG: DUF2285 domain-containing protein [Gammaproteobacteria bacterium]|nr:DUF2285 domain-containing protein [Gammaproteobacteria bacterium]
MATNKSEYLDKPPNCQSVTEYDRSHFKLYQQLLDVEVDDADWRDVLTKHFGINPQDKPDRARRIYRDHLARAKWMTTTGYRQLI